MKLCELKKDLPKTLDEMLLLALDPKFICKKCGRVSTVKDAVCKPEKIKKVIKKG